MNVGLGIWNQLTKLVMMLLLIAGLLGVAGWYLPLIRQNERMRKEVQRLDTQMRRETESQRQLKAFVDALRNDPKAVERLAREQLGYAKPGETVVRFEPEETEAALAEGFLLKRGTLLRSLLGKGERTACTFTTAQEVRLLPFSVAEARYFTREVAELNLPRELNARAAFRLRLRKTIPNPLKDIKADPLTFYIRGSDDLPAQIYEQIFAHKAWLVVQSTAPGKKIVATLPPASIRRGRFSLQQALIPPGPRNFEGYRAQVKAV